VRIAPVGELDLATRARLGQAIDEIRRSGVDRLILDLRRVSFLDSSGLRLALELYAAANGDGFDLELVPGPPQVQRIFERTGTLDALPFRTPESSLERGA
jgi:anti-sigma B factor antagonist